MSRLRPLALAASAAIWAAMPVAVQAAEAPACIPSAQAEALMQLLMPSVLETVGKQCAGTVPNHVFRMQDSALLARYAQAAQATRGDAMKALQHFGMPDISDKMFDAVTEELARTIAKDKMFGTMDQSGCLAIDRMLGSAEALEPAAFARMVVALVVLSQKGEKSRKPNICPFTE